MSVIILRTMTTRSQRSTNSEREVSIIEVEDNSEDEVEDNSEDEDEGDGARFGDIINNEEEEEEEEEEESGEDYHNMIRDNIVSYLPESTLIRECWNISRIYLCWILVHMISVNMYCHFCAHISLYGLFMSPFVTVAPHCVALRWLTTNSINSISHMWTVIGAWLITKIPITFTKS